MLQFHVQTKDGEYLSMANTNKGPSRNIQTDHANQHGTRSPLVNENGKVINGGGLPADISKELEKRNIGQR